VWIASSLSQNEKEVFDDPGDQADRTTKRREEKMSKENKSAKHWGFSWAVVIFCLWLGFWIIMMGFLPKAQAGGVPLITWSQIFLGVFAVCVSVFGIFRLEKLEKK
jgi:sterol desaturase/sphingolipid hydroxylase (fatty acid hydroxylase superfamily)